MQCGQNICFDNLMKALCQCQHNFLLLLSENNTIFIQDNPLFTRGSSKLSQGETILWTHLCNRINLQIQKRFVSLLIFDKSVYF